LLKTLRIAFFSGEHGKTEAAAVDKLFEQHQIKAERLWINGPFKADILLHGDADAAIAPLENLPIHLNGVVIAALLKRRNPAECLVVSPHARDESMLFGLRKHGLVFAPAWRQQAQLTDFRPDLEVSALTDKEEFVWEMLQTEALDAAIFPAYVLDKAIEKFHDYHFQHFHPREFVPAPGQAALAALAIREDISTRKALQVLHNPNISALTNIERACLRLAGDSYSGGLGVYAERDQQYNYHVKAVFAESSDSLQRAGLSSSTNFRLSERILKDLGVNFEKHPTA
jgi:porphobilinogen deaminase